MEKDNVAEMLTLKEYLEKQGKTIHNIKYIGKVELEELINKEPHIFEKDVYICNETIVDKNGQEISIDEYYTEDMELLAREDERYESLNKDENAIMLAKKYEKQPQLIEKLKELDEKGQIDLNKITEENLEKTIRVAESLGVEKENIKELSEIDLERLKSPEFENEIKAKSKLQIKANEKVSTRDTMATLLNVEGKGYTTIDVVDLGNGPQFVGTKANGQMEEIDSLKQKYGKNPNRNINAVNKDGSKVQDEQSIAIYGVTDRKEEQLAIEYGQFNTMKVSLVRTSPETNESISIPIEANTIVHTNHEEKEFMDSNKNPKMREETKRLQNEEDHGCDPITKRDIDDDPTNNTHEHADEEYVPGTYITWQEFANKLGYRGSGAIEKTKQEFNKKVEREKMTDPTIDNNDIIDEMEEEAVEQSGPDLSRNQP